MSGAAFLFGLGVNSTDAYSFIHANKLDPADYACFAVSIVLLAGYEFSICLFNTCNPRISLPSQISFFTVNWSKTVMANPKLQVTATQAYRSALMVITIFTSISLGVAAAVVNGVFQVWSYFGVVRYVAPLMCALFALVNFCFVGMSFYDLHIHIHVSPLIESGAHGIQYTESQHIATKKRTATLALQMRRHFRWGWRAMVWSLAFLMWSLSPYLMLVMSAIIVLHLYFSDVIFEENDKPQDVPQHLEEIVART